jgi:hypothetical protein
MESCKIMPLGRATLKVRWWQREVDALPRLVTHQESNNKPTSSTPHKSNNTFVNNSIKEITLDFNFIWTSLEASSIQRI